jgi:hypothetical protein
MKSAGETGLKITAAQREYFRYTGSSAELERRGRGTSRPELAWWRRHAQQESNREGELSEAGEDNYSNQ